MKGMLSGRCCLLELLMPNTFSPILMTGVTSAGMSRPPQKDGECESFKAQHSADIKKGKITADCWADKGK
jgi:hypothetical protein